MSGAAPVALVASPREREIDAALEILASGRPLLPLHPRHSPEERARTVARVMESEIPDGTGAILATSGSTGEPKLCALSTDALFASARASRANIPLGRGDRWLLVMSFAHAGGLSILTRCLEAGASVVGIEADAFSTARVIEALRSGVTHVSLVPTMLAKLLDEGGGDALASVRAALVGGAACPPALYERARREGVPILTTYGLTEAGSQVSTQRLAEPARRTASDSGDPLGGTRVSIERGRIVVRGPTLMSGYLGAPPIRGVFETEDVGRVDEEGRLHVLGRADDMIVTGGENVHPLEVERALASITGVEAALVCGIPDPTWGEIVGAVVVLTEGARLEAIDEEARSALPSFRVPRRWKPVPALPIAPSGKPDRRAARALFTHEVGASTGPH
ncbi:MAG: AMP-binding protein [Polyangiaceae bacterium]